MRFHLAAIVLGVCLSAATVRAADVVLAAGFDEQTAENFGTEFPGGASAVSDADYGAGGFALKCTGESTVDVERYIKYTDQDTKVGFQYKAVGMKTIRVLAQSVEDNENLYFNLRDVPQGTWQCAVVKLADLRNVVPRHGGPDLPFGDRTGKGKTFKNLVFHLMDLDKKVEAPCVYLDSIVIYRGADTKVPELKGAVKFSADPKGAFLAWPDAKDDVGVARYLVFKGADATMAVAEDAKPAAETVIPEVTVPADGAWYRVVAVDYDGNRSQPSGACQAK